MGGARQGACHSRVRPSRPARIVSLSDFSSHLFAGRATDARGALKSNHLDCRQGVGAAKASGSSYSRRSASASGSGIQMNLAEAFGQCSSLTIRMLGNVDSVLLIKTSVCGASNVSLGLVTEPHFTNDSECTPLACRPLPSTLRAPISRRGAPIPQQALWRLCSRRASWDLQSSLLSLGGRDRAVTSSRRLVQVHPAPPFCSFPSFYLALWCLGGPTVLGKRKFSSYRVGRFTIYASSTSITIVMAPLGKNLENNVISGFLRFQLCENQLPTSHHSKH